MNSSPLRASAVCALTSILLSACAIRTDTRAPVTRQRPTVSRTTATTAAGAIELEAGVAVDPGDAYSIDTTLRHGLDERTELFLGWRPYAHVDRPGDDGDGLGDMLVGLARRVYEEEQTSFAFQMATKLPTGDEDEGLSTGEVDFLVAAIGTQAIEKGPEVTGWYELGVIGEPRDADTGLQHTIALAAELPLEGSLSAFGELSRRHAAFGRDPLLAILGVAKEARVGLVFDGGLAIGLNDDAPDFALLFGVTTHLGSVSSPGSPR